MLPRKHRLSRPADFARVHANGRSRANRMLVLLYYPSDHGESRFGFSVSRRIGNAVVRNRVKRVLREVVRLQLDLVSPGWDIVFIARRGCLDADYAAYERSVSSLLGSARLLASTQSGSRPEAR